MEGTRLMITRILQKEGQATVADLAQALGLAPATTRRHLDILQRDSMVEYVEVKKKTGRTEYSFCLTDLGQESLPKDYSKLLASLLQQMSLLSNEETSGRTCKQILDVLFKRLALQVASRYQSEWEGGDPSERLSTLLRALGDEDFLPQAESDRKGVSIQLLNCPFRSVALENKAICSFDTHLISTILGVPAAQEQCISDGGICCTYFAGVKLQSSAV